jgi:hypothetical protein
MITSPQPNGPPSRPRSLRRRRTIPASVLILCLCLVTGDPVGAQAVPTLAVSPASGPPGTTITVSGARFPRHTRVVLTWDGSASGLPSPLTHGQGSFQVGITIPPSSAARHTLTAEAGGEAASVIIMVTGSTTPTATATETSASTPTPTSTRPPTPTSIPIPTSTPRPTSGASYFVDCAMGSDGNTGTSEAAAWQSLARANNASLAPGDDLLLKRGCVWTGPLVLTRSGTVDRPISVGAYGSGALPIIQNATSANVQVYGSYVVVGQIEARATNPDRIEAGCNNQPVGYRLGFRFYSGAAFDTLEDVVASGNTHGVQVDWGAHHMRILRSDLHHNIMMRVDTPGGDDDAGATGVLLLGDDNEVAYNSIHENRACSYDYGTDGGAVEVYGSSRNRIHHNRSWANDIFSELGTESGHSADSNTYAYNVSSNEWFLTTRGGGTFGPVTATRVYNSVAYGGGVTCYAGCGPSILTLENDIIWSGSPLDVDHSFNEGYNIYFGGPPNIAISSTSRFIDPQFVNPDGGDFHVASTSPAINAGTDESVKAGFTVDVDGRAVPQGSAVDIGAYER